MLFACISGLAQLTGCATAWEGLTSGHELQFRSEPPGAEVKLSDEEEHCTTPCEIYSRPAINQKARASLEGYPDQSLTLERHIAYAFWGNLAFVTLAPVGFVVDWLDGFMWSYRESSYHFTFKAAAPPPDPEAPPPEELPNTPELAQLKERFPEAYMLEQIHAYYGEQDEADEHAILIRLYKIMLGMMRDGDSPNVDEAVRRDHF